MWLKIVIPILLIIVNFYFIYKSNRMRRYGIFPGRISIVLTSALCIYYFLVVFSISNNQLPKVPPKKKAEISNDTYQKELNEYWEAYAKKENKFSFHFNILQELYYATAVQIGISLICSAYGLITIKRRRDFYIITTGMFLVAIILAIYLNKLI